MRGIKSFELCGHFTGNLSKCIVSCGVRTSPKSDMTPANSMKKLCYLGHRTKCAQEIRNRTACIK
jgi:hypothetical protein